ncbi:hypothetical protein G6F55_014106 [Rhizopus delemar]|nr:hypothetical protein G6F55_014106 [Rhizopus delemar]
MPRPHRLQVHATAVSAVTAAHGEGITGAAAGGQVDAPGIDHVDQARCRERANRVVAAASEQRTGVVDGERTGAGAGIAQHQSAVEGQFGAAGLVDR